MRIFSSEEYRLRVLRQMSFKVRSCGVLMTFCSMSHRSLLNGDDEPKTLL